MLQITNLFWLYLSLSKEKERAWQKIGISKLSFVQTKFLKFYFLFRICLFSFVVITINFFKDVNVKLKKKNEKKNYVIRYHFF